MRNSAKLKKMKLSIEYHRKWLIIGMAAGFVNVLAGIVVGIGMWTDPKLQKEGKIVVIVSLVWALVAILVLNRFAPRPLV